MDGYIGQVMLFPTKWVPQNWRICDGSVLPVDGNQAAGVVIGNISNEDVEFSLPIIDSPHSDYVYIICINGNFPDRS